MTKPTTLHVTAAPGKMVPIHASDRTAPGNRLLVIEPGQVEEVPNTTGIRRRIRAGDLVVVDAPAEFVDVEPPELEPPPDLPRPTRTTVHEIGRIAARDLFDDPEEEQ